MSTQKPPTPPKKKKNAPKTCCECCSGWPGPWSVTPKRNRERAKAHTRCVSHTPPPPPSPPPPATEVHCGVQKHSDKEEEENEGSDKRFSVGNSLDPRVQCAEELAPSLFSGEEPPCSAAIYVLSESFREDYCMESYSYSLLQPGCVGLHVDYNPPAMLTTDLAPPPRSRSHCALSLMLNELGAAGRRRQTQPLLH